MQKPCQAGLRMWGKTTAILSLQLGVSNLFFTPAGIAVISEPWTGLRLVMPFGATTRPTLVQSTGLPRNSQGFQRRI